MCLVTFDWEKSDAAEKYRRYLSMKTPSWAVVELTDSCNFRCIWCYAGVGQGTRLGHMRKDCAVRLVKMLAESGIRQVTCSGGEPTLYPHLRDFVSECSEHGIITHINTNGYLLTKSMALELKRAGLSQVQTNIDSLMPREHDYVRGRTGSFHRAVKAIKNSVSAGLTTVSQTVLTSRNEKHIPEILEFARSLGVQRFRIWDMTGEGSAKGRMDLIPSDYVETLKRVSLMASKSGAKSVESCDPLFPLGFKCGLDNFGMGCVAVRGLLMHVSSGGEVFYCATHRKPMYNVFDAGLSDLGAFHKGKVEEYVKGFRISEKCIECGFFQQCRGGCAARRSFSVNNIDYFCPLSGGRGIGLRHGSSC